MTTTALRSNPAYFAAREACPVCGSRRVSLLYAAPYAEDPVRAFVLSHYKGQGRVDLDCLQGTDFALCDCADCGTIYQRHIPNAFLLDKVYNEMISAETLGPRQMRRLTIARFERIAGEMAELFALVPKPPSEIRMLDYGAGYGARARVAVALGAEVFATEISPDKVAYGKAIGVRMVGEDALDAMRFDIVHTEQVFEHLTEPRAVFFRLARLVAPGGILKVSVPAAGNIRALLKSRGMAALSPLESDWQTPAERKAARRNAAYMCVVPLEHLNVFSLRGIRMLSREAGLEVIATVRRQAVPVSVASAPRFAKSLAELARVMARVVLRSALRRDSGYYLMRRPAG